MGLKIIGGTVFDDNGTVVGGSEPVVLTPALFRPAAVGTVAAVATADATDLASAQALANQLKTTVNALLVELKDGGYIPSS